MVRRGNDFILILLTTDRCTKLCEPKYLLIAVVMASLAELKDHNTRYSTSKTLSQPENRSEFFALAKAEADVPTSAERPPYGET